MPPRAWTAASSIAVLAAYLGISPDVANRRLVLAPLNAPLNAPTGLRSVDGFRTGTARLSVQIGPDGTTKLSGAPAGTEVFNAASRERA
jgi:hypothetical protein